MLLQMHREEEGAAAATATASPPTAAPAPAQQQEDRPIQEPRMLPDSTPHQQTTIDQQDHNPHVAEVVTASAPTTDQATKASPTAAAAAATDVEVQQNAEAEPVLATAKHRKEDAHKHDGPGPTVSGGHATHQAALPNNDAATGTTDGDQPPGNNDDDESMMSDGNDGDEVPVNNDDDEATVSAEPPDEAESDDDTAAIIAAALQRSGDGIEAPVNNDEDKTMMSDGNDGDEVPVDNDDDEATVSEDGGEAPVNDNDDERPSEDSEEPTFKPTTTNVLSPAKVQARKTEVLKQALEVPQAASTKSKPESVCSSVQSIATFPCHQCSLDFPAEELMCCTAMKSTTRACSRKYCRTCLDDQYGMYLDECKTDHAWKCPACSGSCTCPCCLSDFSKYGGTRTKKVVSPRRVGRKRKMASPRTVDNKRKKQETGRDTTRWNVPRKFMLLLADENLKEADVAREAAVFGGIMVKVWCDTVITVLASKELMSKLEKVLEVAKQPGAFSQGASARSDGGNMNQQLYNALAGKTISRSRLQECAHAVKKGATTEEIDGLLNRALTAPDQHDSLVRQILNALQRELNGERERSELINVDRTGGGSTTAVAPASIKPTMHTKKKKLPLALRLLLPSKGFKSEDIFQVLEDAGEVGWQSQRRDTNTKASCHHCVLDFPVEEVAACTNSKSQTRKCAYKYCKKCLINYYQVDFGCLQDTGMLWDFICPSCQGKCECSKCRDCFDDYKQVAYRVAKTKDERESKAGKKEATAKTTKKTSTKKTDKKESKKTSTKKTDKKESKKTSTKKTDKKESKKTSTKKTDEKESKKTSTKKTDKKESKKTSTKKTDKKESKKTSMKKTDKKESKADKKKVTAKKTSGSIPVKKKTSTMKTAKKKSEADEKKSTERRKASKKASTSSTVKTKSKKQTDGKSKTDKKKPSTDMKKATGTSRTPTTTSQKVTKKTKEISTVKETQSAKKEKKMKKKMEKSRKRKAKASVEEVSRHDLKRRKISADGPVIGSKNRRVPTDKSTRTESQPIKPKTSNADTKWTKDEDAVLISEYFRLGGSKWISIATAVSKMSGVGKTRQQVKDRWESMEGLTKEYNKIRNGLAYFSKDKKNMEKILEYKRKSKVFSSNLSDVDLEFIKKARAQRKRKNNSNAQTRGLQPSDAAINGVEIDKKSKERSGATAVEADHGETTMYELPIPETYNPQLPRNVDSFYDRVEAIGSATGAHLSVVLHALYVNGGNIARTYEYLCADDIDGMSGEGMASRRPRIWCEDDDHFLLSRGRYDPNIVQTGVVAAKARELQNIFGLDACRERARFITFIK